MIGYVFRHDGAGADKRVLADGVAADDGAVGAECCALFDKSGADLVHFPDFCPRVVYVGKDHGRAAEDAVFQCNAFIDADVVLYLTFVADDCVRSNT